MTDMYTPPAPEQHDTTAIPRPYPPGYISGNPAADAWETKYRSQRTRTRIAVTVAAVTSAAALVLGVATWQVSQNPLLSAASQLASGDLDLGENTAPTTPEGTSPDAITPDGPAPEGTAPDAQAPHSPDVPLSELPIPDSLKSMASAIGITDVGQLLDLAVANGIMTQEDADNLRSGIAAGALANGLTQGQAESQ